ncbi:MAG TPA: flagellar protein FliS [Bosea sp. (in: a-proteobacteria)]|jgi:flagellar protein FliS|uniref:flagellar export chaperone FliS n=1 Tax=Bosea sp. (in: a-proteobacteria) TaxID=1871050 RepID=UPI002DDDA3EB|nr:flagellar protein FliS [Bosea sp. (in: a-proteobacteria)]HEV2555702.1 flagellar protein FliS [Bosea sp. (in: a-proteobacteria)]
MNQHAQPLAAYRRVAAQVHPLVAVVKLYDEAIRQLRLAILATQDQRHEESHACITRSSTILRGLCHCLRFDKGEEVAQQLLKAYTYNIMAIHTAYGRRDAKARYEKIVFHLTGLRNAWAQIAGMTPKTQVAPAASPRLRR